MNRKRVRQTLLERFPFCVYCRSPLRINSTNPCHRPTLDHVLPISRGGDNSPGNVRLACACCNLSKGCRTPEEWAADVLAALV
jgi:5-methylcytosine-specific restriction endonuclease McrA